MTRNESMLQFQRRLLNVAAKSPRLNAMNMLGIVYSNLEEFVRVRMPLDKNPDITMDQFTEVVELFMSILETKFTTLYTSNKVDLVDYDGLAQELKNDFDESAVAAFKYVRQELNANHNLGVMIHGRFYCGMIALTLLKRLLGMAKEENPDMDSKQWQLEFMLSSPIFAGARRKISAPVSADTKSAMVNVMDWLNSPIGDRYNVKLIIRYRDNMSSHATLKVNDRYPMGIIRNYGLYVDNPLFFRFNEVSKYIIDRTPVDVKERLKYEERSSQMSEFTGVKEYDFRNILYPGKNRKRQTVLFRTPMSPLIIYDELMKKLQMSNEDRCTVMDALSNAHNVGDLINLIRSGDVDDWAMLNNGGKVHMTIYRTDTIGDHLDLTKRPLNGLNVKFIVMVGLLLREDLTIFIEARARDSESNNINLAKTLQQLGVDVHLVSPNYSKCKIHAKVWSFDNYLDDKLVSVNLWSTGNFSEQAQNGFSDSILLEYNENYRNEMTDFWHDMETSHKNNDTLPDFMWKPRSIKKELLEYINDIRVTSENYPVDDAESISDTIPHYTEGVKGRICIKCNHITDPDIIEALVKAAESDVEVNVLVRSTCLLPLGVSNLRVRSIAGKYLEHDRIYSFQLIHYKDEQPVEDSDLDFTATFISSADLMERNLEERVEFLKEVQHPHDKKLMEIFDTMFQKESDAREGFFNFHLNNPL